MQTNSYGQKTEQWLPREGGWIQEGQLGRITHGHKETLGDDEYVDYLGHSQGCQIYVKTYQIAYFKYVQFISYTTI